jgi:hypothetical protein
MPEGLKSLNDIGTRYTHLRDLAGELEDGIEVYTRRIQGQGTFQNLADVKVLIKLSLTLEVVMQFIELDSLYKDNENQYKLSRLIDSVKLDPEVVASIIPLDKEEIVKHGAD